MAGTIIVDRIESDASYASTINVAGQITFSNTVNFGAFAGTAPVAGFYLPTTNNLAFTTASTERMRIDSSGNVGIGTNSPTSILNVKSSGPIFRLETTGAVASGGVAYNAIRDSTGSDVFISGYAGLANCYQFGTIPAAGFMRFLTGAQVEAMRIDSSGNVGIGTSSPTYGTLEVAQGSAGVVSVINNTVGAWAFRKVRSDGSNGMGIYDASGFGVPAFYASGSERMRITSSGNLLVGTTSETPGYTNTNTGVQLSNNGSHFSRAATDWVMTVNQNTADGSARYLIGFRVSNGQVGNIQSNGTNCTYNSNSDYRLKENIAPMTDALTKVAQLKPVTYKWKVDGSDGEGFIAHELAEVVPECVTGVKDAVDVDGNPIYQGIDTSFLVATLTAAIQEQQALIQALTTRIAALESN